MDIVKVQRPLMTTDPDAPALIYAQGRRNLVTQPMRELPPWLQRLLVVEPKVYCEADFRAGRWRISRQSPSPHFW